jgi:hypothetical protein
MNDQILNSLIQILQKHTNAIRTLKIANIALMELARQEAEKSGTPSEEFETRFLAILSAVEKSGRGRPDIAKEIEETSDELNLLEQQARANPN